MTDPKPPQPEVQSDEARRAPGKPRGRLKEWFARRFLPERRTRRGISFAALLGALAFGGFVGSRLHTGQGTFVDIGIGAGVTLGLALVMPLALALLAGTARLLPRFVGYFGVGAFLAFAYLLDESGFSTGQAFASAGLLLVIVALAFGNLAALTGSGFAQRTRLGKLRTVVGLLVGVAGAGVVGWFLFDSGSDEHLVGRVAAAESSEPAAADAPDPSQSGGFPVQQLTYGSGTDRRPEFGDSATLKTSTVNGKPFVEWPDGWKGAMRTRYWGFDASRLPVNGRVWYPDGDGPFPLILCVHGNHHMADYSDPGYGYLGELLASRGFVFVSVDENFLNSGGFAHGGMRNENDARAFVLLEHLKVWRTWNATQGNPFYGRVDLDRVGLAGHSRGGEAVCHAAVFNRLERYPDDASVEFDYGFGIRAVCSIAPIDGQYRPAGRDTPMRNVSYFVIHGGHDADVSSFYGDRIYRRLRLDDPESDRFKASLWIYRANHGQFNTVWGDSDAPPPRSLFLNRSALLTGAEQRQIAAVFISAFFEASLSGNDAYRALFKNHRTGRAWLPDVWMVSSYEDASFRPIADFDEDVDVTTTTIEGGSIAAERLQVWREAEIPMRGGSRRMDNGVFLGWNTEPEETPSGGGEPGVAEAATDAGPVDARPADVSPAEGPAPSFTITLAEGLAADLGDALVLHLAEAEEKPEPKDYSETPENRDAEDAEGADDAEPPASAADDQTDDQADEQEPDESERTPIDLTIQLIGADGTTTELPLSRFGLLPPPMKVRLIRDPSGREKDSVEPVLQRFELPLSAFQPALPADAIRAIRLVFDRVPKGVVILDRVGFARL